MPMPDGAVTIIDAEGMQVAHIAQPWAKDAHGKPVPTKYEVHETTVTQVVEHADTSVTYPVVADPEVRVEWWGFAAKLSRSETRDLANLVGTKASFVAALCAFIPNPVGIAACIAGVELRIAFWMDPINQASAEGKCAQINQPHIGGILSSNVTKENC